MRTTDLFKNNRSAKRLNESLAKTFGRKLNLETFSIEQLEDARNKLRTQIYTARNSSNFNETVENDALTQAQFMHDAIVAELAERNEPIVDNTVQEAPEDRTSYQVARILADNGMSYDSENEDEIIDAIGMILVKELDMSPGQARAVMNDEDFIGDTMGELQSMSDNDDEGGDTDDSYALASAGHGSDEDYGTFDQGESVQNEVAPPTAKGERMVKHIKKGYADDGKLTDKEKSIAYATAWKQHNKESVETGDDMTRLQEGEIQQASAIVTAKTMVDRVGRWIEELSGMENDTLLQLGDSIRDEMGQEQAKAFISTCAPAIQAALENLKQARETLSGGVRALTGEEQPAEMLGGEPGADMAAPAEPDAMNAPSGDDLGGEPAGDDFDAAEPAAGGLGDAGREQRESIDRQSRLMKVLAG
jgi:hypothetical protein